MYRHTHAVWSVLAFRAHFWRRDERRHVCASLIKAWCQTIRSRFSVTDTASRHSRKSLDHNSRTRTIISNISDNISSMAFKLGMAVDLCMTYMSMLVSMTLTLTQGHTGSAKAKYQRWIISTTMQAISIKLAFNSRHFFTCRWLWKCYYEYDWTILFRNLSVCLIFVCVPLLVCPKWCCYDLC